MIPNYLNGHVKIVNVELQYYTKNSCPWGLQGTKEDADKLDVTVSQFHTFLQYLTSQYTTGNCVFEVAISGKTCMSQDLWQIVLMHILHE